MKEYIRRYQQSEKGKQKEKEYRRSEKGRELHRISAWKSRQRANQTIDDKSLV